MTYPVKLLSGVWPYLDTRDINKAIVWENHEPQTVEEITHQLAGPEGILAGSPHSGKQQTTGDQHSQSQVDSS